MNAFITALPGVFDAIDGSEEVREAFVFAAWRHVSGSQVAARTSPIAAEKRRLIVAVADKTWKRNLESLAPQLLFKLNCALARPTIDFLEFRIDPERIHPTADKEELDAETPATPDELSISAGTIRDKQLRETVLKAAVNCLSRRM